MQSSDTPQAVGANWEPLDAFNRPHQHDRRRVPGRRWRSVPLRHVGMVDDDDQRPLVLGSGNANRPIPEVDQDRRVLVRPRTVLLAYL